jgi:hypothetical protein
MITTDKRKCIMIVKISRSLQNLKTNFSLIKYRNEKQFDRYNSTFLMNFLKLFGIDCK